jgi:hypothetical protein
VFINCLFYFYFFYSQHWHIWCGSNHWCFVLEGENQGKNCKRSSAKFIFFLKNFLISCSMCDSNLCIPVKVKCRDTPQKSRIWHLAENLQNNCDSRNWESTLPITPNFPR